MQLAPLVIALRGGLSPSSGNNSSMRGVAASEPMPPEAVKPWWAKVWSQYCAEYGAQSRSKPRDDEELRRELVFCLLGGHGVTFELASSATEVVTALDPFAPHWTTARLRVGLRRELARRQFDPPRLDGSFRRYRFPTRKANLLAEAASWVRTEGSIQAGLEGRVTESERRVWLCTCPGVGMKTASWLLRNCGWARELAILDVHVLRAMREVRLVGEIRLPRDYVAVERTYLRWAAELGACPAALDLFLWDLQRSGVSVAA